MADQSPRGHHPVQAEPAGLLRRGLHLAARLPRAPLSARSLALPDDGLAGQAWVAHVPSGQTAPWAGFDECPVLDPLATGGPRYRPAGRLTVPAGHDVSLAVDQPAELERVGDAAMATIDRLACLDVPAAATLRVGRARVLVALLASGPGADDRLAAELAQTEVRAVLLPEAALTDVGLARLANLPRLGWLDVSFTPARGDGLAAFDPDGPLVALNALGAALDDAGAKHLGALAGLEALNVAGTRLTDDGLARLAGLPRLSTLRLGSGLLTSAGLAVVAQLPALQRLRISGMADLRQGLGAVGRAIGLRQVTLDGTRPGDSGIAQLGGLLCLEHLSLRDTGITDVGVRFLTGLPRLTSLDLRNNALGTAALVEICRMPTLESLSLPVGGMRTTALAGLARLRGLRRLSLYDLERSAGLDWLAELAAVTDLWLSGPGVDDAALDALAAMPTLERLWLVDTRVSNAGLPRLAALARLRTLGLQRSAVTPEGFDWLRQALPACRLLGRATGALEIGLG